MDEEAAQKHEVESAGSSIWAASLKDRGMVDRPTPCTDCGYELESLDLAGKCPECGCPIRLSYRDQHFVDRDFVFWRNAAVIASASNLGLLLLSMLLGLVAPRPLWGVVEVLFMGSLYIAWIILIPVWIWCVRSEEARGSPAVHVAWFIQFLIGGYLVWSNGLIQPSP